MAEDHELCTHYKYHKHKLILFLSAMRSHADEIRSKHSLNYYPLSKVSSSDSFEDKLIQTLEANPTIQEVITYEIEDHFFEKRIREFCSHRALELTIVDSPGFLTSKSEFKEYLDSVKKPFMHTFYQRQRKRLDILVDSNGNPLNEKWSFDEDNRKKLPKGIKIPDQPSVEPTKYTIDVSNLVDELFPDHPGETGNFGWATTRDQVMDLLDVFLKERFEQFGPYEDAIDSKEVFIFHSVLSPYINMGLITPGEILVKVMQHYERNETHYPSVEGFVRQIIGWREFIRGIYHNYDDELNVNHFNHRRKLKDCWYEGTTGIPPLDNSIKKAVKHGYTHHIERLMVIGNMMLLCEIDPDDVYKWFMELYVDSSDWVMAPNVYGMSQFADGGIFATKPYIGGSNYIRKMSNFGKGEWELIMNGLYWRFIDINRSTFSSNPRMSMMVRTLDKMDVERRERLFTLAESFINKSTIQG